MCLVVSLHLKRLAARILAVWCVCAHWFTLSSLGGTTKPNIVFVLIDDMGWGDFSCFGNQDARTPNIDQIASEGIRFTQFYVSSPICSPSRCGFITGQYPQRWRITSFLNNRAENNRRGMANWLDPQAPSLPRILQANGYATGHFGKWHLGGQRDVDDAPLITSYGFDESLTNFEGMGPKLLPLTLKPGEDKPGRIWGDAERLGGPVTWMQRSQITNGYIDAALRFMDRAVGEQKPFYVDVWPDDMHSPFWPPVDRWQKGKRGLYLAVLEEMDRQLGKLFAHIRDNPSLRDNTLVLICSDNGPEPGVGSAGPFRGHKGTLYEGGIRSPLISWSPGLIEKAQAGTRNETSVIGATDFLPTLLSITQTSTPTDHRTDGEDVASILLGKSHDRRRAPLFWRRPPDRKTLEKSAQPLPDLAARDGDWMLLCDYDGQNPHLFNVQNDPGEKTDLAASEPETVTRLSILLTTWHQSLPPDNGPSLESPK